MIAYNEALLLFLHFFKVHLIAVLEKMLFILVLATKSYLDM